MLRVPGLVSVSQVTHVEPMSVWFGLTVLVVIFSQCFYVSAATLYGTRVLCFQGHCLNNRSVPALAIFIFKRIFSAQISTDPITHCFNRRFPPMAFVSDLIGQELTNKN